MINYILKYLKMYDPLLRLVMADGFFSLPNYNALLWISLYFIFFFPGLIV